MLKLGKYIKKLLCVGTLPLQYEQCVWYTQGEVLLLKHVLSTAVHSLGSSSNFHDNLQINAILYSFVLRRDN